MVPGRLLLLFISFSGCCAQECAYKYTVQPPTELNCNPYNLQVGRLKLTCSTEGPNVQIVWFRMTNGEKEELRETVQSNRIEISVVPSPDTAAGGALSTKLSVNLTINRLNQTHDVGKYWCEVRLADGQRTTLPEMSNVLNLYNEAHYQNFAGCQGSNFVEQQACLQIMDPLIKDDSYPPTPSSEPSLTLENVADEEENGRKDLVALYAVIAVIVVFCIIIVTLTIIIVVLYRKKCGPVRFKTEDHKQTPNPYSGFTRERMNGNHGNLITRTERSDSRMTNSSNQHQQHNFGSSPPPPSYNGATVEDPYSRLVHDQFPGAGQVEVFAGYSQLEIQETIPPLPPKPPSTRSKSRTPPPHTSLVHSPPIHSERQSAIYNDLTDNDIERGIKNNLLPHVNIYNTLDSSAEGLLSPGSQEYQELSPEIESYDYGEEFTEWRINHIPAEASKMSTQKSLFDDPEYSPLKGMKKKVVDPRYAGDYERSPTYTCPTVEVKVGETDPKYRGDYERDPTYVLKLSPRRASCSSAGAHHIPKPDKILKRRKSLEADALHKYAGDYEWSPNYVPAPLRDGSSGPLPLLDKKYSGNYERDPVYMAHVLKSAHGRLRAQSVEYTIPNTLSRENVVQHVSREHAQLKDDFMDPPHEYTRLNSRTPELT